MSSSLWFDLSNEGAAEGGQKLPQKAGSLAVKIPMENNGVSWAKPPIQRCVCVFHCTTIPTNIIFVPKGQRTKDTQLVRFFLCDPTNIQNRRGGCGGQTDNKK